MTKIWRCMVCFTLSLVLSSPLAAQYDRTVTVLIPPTIGAFTQVHLQNALLQLGNFAQQKRLASLQIDNARNAYWDCHPACEDFSSRESEFMTLLFGKDLYYMDALRAREIEGSFGPGTPMTDLLSLAGGEVDGGIPEQCDYAFRQWVYDFREKGADLAAMARNTGAAFEAFEASLPVYRRYQECRDRHEYFTGPKSPLKSDDRETFLLAVLARSTGRSWSIPELEEAYQSLIEILGEPLVLAATGEILSQGESTEQQRIRLQRGAFEAAFHHYMLRQTGDLRVAAIAQLLPTQGSPPLREAWQEADAGYRELVEKRGTDHVLKAASIVQESLVWDAAKKMWIVPLSSGCPALNTAWCLQMLVAMDSPRAVDVAVSANELAAVLPPELGAELLDTVSKLKEAQRQYAAFQYAGSRVDNGLAMREDSQNALHSLHEKLSRACFAKDPPAEPIAGVGRTVKYLPPSS